MKPMFALSVAVAILCISGCGGGADPSRRIEEATRGYCELSTRCEALHVSQLGENAFDDCTDWMTMILASVHYVFGSACIDAYLDQVECRLGYDCDFPDEPSCADDGALCEATRPCEELVPRAERACQGFFVPGPDLGIDWEVP